ncbi:hypothetical protein GMMP1_990076 [Candidatus Magnetomoraceae bacterium gMMP-1]
MVIDACFSGDSQGGVLFTHSSSIFVEANTGRLDKGIVITSSNGKQISSWYPEKRHSLFTYFFLKGIKENASKKKSLPLVQLKKYVSREVNKVSKRLYDRIQIPEFKGNLKVEMLKF